jgi:hypothetical protein
MLSRKDRDTLEDEKLNKKRDNCIESRKVSKA